MRYFSVSADSDAESSSLWDGNDYKYTSWPIFIFPAAAQAAGLELWRLLIEHPEGELLVETAFEGYVSDPLISWHFHATLNSADPQELTADTTPFEDACGYQMQYEFTLSAPKEEG